jgi:hypothetical protein
MPMTNMDTSASLRGVDRNWVSPPAAVSNMSPFARVPILGASLRDEKPLSRFDYHRPTSRFGDALAHTTWGSAPDYTSSTTAALSTSVASALGTSQPYSTVTGGFDEPTGGRSGSSSRRHSVSVVGGPGGRRGFGFHDGQGISSITSPPVRGIGPSGFSDEDLLSERLGNALNLEIDQSRKRGVNLEMQDDQSRRGIPSLPTPQRPSYDLPAPQTIFGSTPDRGRDMTQLRAGPIGAPADTRGPQSLPFVPRDYRAFPNGAPPPNPYARPPANYSQRPPSFNGAPFTNGHPAPFPNGHPSYGNPPPSFTGQQFNLSNQYQPSAHPNPLTSPSSFSSLSLADLGKGLQLHQIAPNNPLYIVAFKAGRRDVFYCPDPTLLISNGDRVIVEADRGSDLGTVIFDQLTTLDVREWQEKQATAALLSGASQHQPPGMAKMGYGGSAPSRTGMEAELHALLAGVGPSGNQMENSGLSTGRGPLAKEIMPKRIFTKANQGPEEQQYVYTFPSCG